MTSTAPTTRPALPIARLNPHLTAIPADNLIVKYQTIVREGNEIIVGRVKVPTPDGHAFILRRYDTGAFSLTTMFKATFPGATETEEKTECDWVKSNFDNAGANGGKSSTDVRLAGSWVVADIALFIANDYGLQSPVAALASASPDPGMQYRKSQRSQAAAAMDTPKKAAAAVAVPTKKVKTETSSSSTEAASLPSLANGLPVPIPSPSKAAAEIEARIKRDLQAGKDLVAKIKKETEEKAAATLKAAEEKGEVVAEEVKKVVKRAFEVEEDVKEAVAGTAADEGVLEEGRAIATNRRAEVPVGRAMQTVKQAAWGAFVFGIGIGATTILPRFFF